MRKIVLGGIVGILALCIVIGVITASGGGGGTSDNGNVARNSSSQSGNSGATTRRQGDSIAGRSGDPGSGSASGSDEAPSGGASEGSNGRVYGLNQPANSGDIVWKITGVDTKRSLRASYMPRLRADGKWVVVEGTVTNNGSDAATADSSVIHLIDGRNREFSASTETTGYIQERKDLFLMQINPGISRHFEVAFDVPKDASDLKFKAGDLQLFGSGEDVAISLGI